MYEEFYGLSEKPFAIQPDPSFLYWGRAHRLAYAMLEYGVLNHAGISVITGEIGCGKTTLIHRLLDQLSETHTVALLSNIQNGRGDLLSWVLMGFGQNYAGKSHVELFAELQRFFIAEYAKGRRIVLVIDEAQNLSVDMLEEIRMLSNINAGKDQLLQLILVGQPELKEILNRPDMLQLAQRIGSDFHLTPLNREEVHAYIETRMTIAGAGSKIFQDSAMDVIADESRGVPRVINTIADTALVYGFSAQDPQITGDTIKLVIQDKGDYGVFGIASDSDLQMPEQGARGPATFLKEVTSGSPAPATHTDEAPKVLSNLAPTNDGGALRQVVSQEMTSAVQARAVTPDELPDAPSEDNQLEPSAEPAVRILPTSPIPAATAVQPPVLSVDSEIAPESVSLENSGIAIIVTAINNGQLLADSLGSAPQSVKVVCAVRHQGDVPAEFVGQENVDVVELGEAALTEGRARNAAYRRLKKIMPDLKFVQFLDQGAVLSTDWLPRALRFMDRRPEVVVIEGATSNKTSKPSLFSRLRLAELEAAPGEAVTTGSMAFIRASAFEAAGGFRGDISGLEVADLCIRLRRRGFHVWRIEAAMAYDTPTVKSFGDWLGQARKNGELYARAAALHGSGPERFRVAEQARAMIWGLGLPLFVALVAILGGVAVSLFVADTNPLLISAGILGGGAMVYVLKVLIAALRHGGKSDAWAYAFFMTLGHFAEAFGVLGAWLGGKK